MTEPYYRMPEKLLDEREGNSNSNPPAKKKVKSNEAYHSGSYITLNIWFIVALKTFSLFWKHSKRNPNLCVCGFFFVNKYKTVFIKD